MLLLLAVLAALGSVLSLGCLNESGQQVPWFIAIKKANSYNYVYMDSNSNGSLVNAGNSLAGKSGAIMGTLNQLWTNSSLGSLMFNDEFPEAAPGKASGSKAHMKGIVGVDSAGKTGFYLLHSAPGFPNPTASPLEYFQNKTIYGQSFICLSVDAAGLNTIGSAIKDDYPSIYQNTLPQSVKTTAPNLYEAGQGAKTSNAAAFSRKISAVGSGDSFLIFSKNSQWAKHFWAELVAPTLGSDMYAETWIRESGLVPYCKSAGYKYNVNFVKDVTMGGSSWKESNDHSKWAVTSNYQWLCIGDINVMTTQTKRGGGAICINKSSVANAFKATINFSSVNGCANSIYSDEELDFLYEAFEEDAAAF